MPRPRPSPSIDALAGLSPAHLVLLWPSDRPLAALLSHRRGRWSVLAEPKAWLSLESTGWRWTPNHTSLPSFRPATPPPSSSVAQASRLCDDLRDSSPVAQASRLCDDLRDSSPVAQASRLCDDLRAALHWARAQHPPSQSELPFAGGFIASFAYELGHLLEPAAGPRDAHPHWPLALLAWCPDALVHDAHTDRWSVVGTPALPDRIDPAPTRSSIPAYDLGRLRPARDAAADYQHRVADLLARIRAGEVYQVNLAHRLSARFAGSARALLHDLTRRARPPFAAYLDAPPGPQRRALVSVSPELLASLDARTRAVVTRPIKGTRPASADPAELLQAPKDRAELDMIVDLMRNDLGRVCQIGSVRVEQRRAIERHGGVLQAVATIAGTLRDDADAIDLLAAAFPAGSITGAPKVQAMRTIAALEPAPRGPYCGSVGYLGADGGAALSVAIRTGLIVGEADGSRRDGFVRARLDYHVGAGIVADSNPEAEWRETLAKVRAWRAPAAARGRR